MQHGHLLKKLNLDLLGWGVGAGLQQNIFDHVVAFEIPFNLVKNVTKKS